MNQPEAPDATVSDVVARMLLAVDDLDWPAIRAAFTDRVAVDYTSLWGGEAEAVAADDLVGQWRQLLPGFDATQHITGPVVVTGRDGRQATATTTVRGYHRIVDDDGSAATWMAAGRYVIGLAHDATGWRIDAMTLLLTYEDGDRGLADLARKRVASGRPART